MVYSKFKTSILLRVFLLVLNSFVLTYSVYLGNYLYISFALALLLLIQAYQLIKHINKIHQYLTMFLRMIRESRDSYTLPARSSDYILAELSAYFKEIREVIKDAKIEKENQYHYLQYVVEHVGIGLMAFDSSGKVELLNNAAKKIFKVPTILNIKTLDTIDKNISQTLWDLQPNQQKTLILNIDNELLHLSFKAAQFKMLEKTIKLISFQNIKAELDEKELDSWQKLIRILNHEIMNSITPITTLTTTIKKSFVAGDGFKTKDNIDDELVKDTVLGLSIIEERGKGLISFVNKYRSLSTSIKPNIEKVAVKKLITNVTELLKPDFEKNGIKVSASYSEEDLEIFADERLVEQVLINLLKNSIQALQRKRDKNINVIAAKSNSRTTIQIVDNGKGIPPEEIENIFIPFYTTKEKGSGIGLSLSRQIMRLHKGAIKVASTLNEHTTFTLTF